MHGEVHGMGEVDMEGRPCMLTSLPKFFDVLPSTPSELCTHVLLHPTQMWKYEGAKTLSYYTRRRDTIRALSQDLEVAEDAVLACPRPRVRARGLAGDAWVMA